MFGGLVLMESKVTKSLIPPANQILYATNVGLPLSNVAHQSLGLLTKYQLTDAAPFVLVAPGRSASLVIAARF